MKKHAKYTERSCTTSTMGSTQNLSKISLNGLLDCSVTLEKLDMSVSALNEPNASHASIEKVESSVKSPIGSPVKPASSESQQIKISHAESMAVNTDADIIETMAPINEAVRMSDGNSVEHLELMDIELDPQMNYDQNQYYFEADCFNETGTPSLLHNFDANAYDYNLNPDPLVSFVDAHLGHFQVKEEKEHALSEQSLPHTLSNESMIYEVLDSDEEDALNARDSGRETNDTIIEADSSHIPTMGVLMMAKK